MPDKQYKPLLVTVKEESKQICHRRVGQGFGSTRWEEELEIPKKILLYQYSACREKL